MVPPPRVDAVFSRSADRVSRRDFASEPTGVPRFALDSSPDCACLAGLELPEATLAATGTAFARRLTTRVEGRGLFDGDDDTADEPVDGSCAALTERLGFCT